ncbi:MAG: hypothetical protein DIU70_006890 [Bacillota bacterium]|nr:MAG: hypothetical protein DIU70_02510 [Bacillota bacterium]
MPSDRRVMGFVRAAASGTALSYLLMLGVGMLLALVLGVVGAPSFSWSLGPVPVVTYSFGGPGGDWTVEFGAGVVLLALLVGLIRGGLASRRA